MCDVSQQFLYLVSSFRIWQVDCAGNSMRTISIIASSFQVLCVINRQASSVVRLLQYSFDHESVVSSSSLSWPHHASSLFIAISKFCPLPSVVACFEECLKGLRWISEMFHGVTKKFSSVISFLFFILQFSLLFAFLFIVFVIFFFYLFSFSPG
jgi:hypothetical protein